MIKSEKKYVIIGIVLLLLFTIWTVLILTVGVKPVGVNGTDVGFAELNTKFHEATGVHTDLYDLTDVLSAVPFLICLCFAALGLWQWIKRKKLFSVDADILILGCYYIVVIAAFFFFQIVRINCRPVLIEGVAEPSYPSSTTLLTASVLPSLIYQLLRRVNNRALKITAVSLAGVFCAFMIVARVISGVHWLTDIVGGLLLSAGLFCLYIGIVKCVKPAPVSPKTVNN